MKNIVIFLTFVAIIVLSLSIINFTKIYEKREKAKLNVEMIRLSLDACKGLDGASYNLETGFFTCK